MDAKNNFREGHIMLLRPFDFAELEFSIPKLTILYAYIEKPLFEQELSEKGKELMEDMNSSNQFFGGSHKYKKGIFETDEQYERRMDQEHQLFDNDSSNFISYHSGNLVQSIIDGQMCRFYPDEYNIIGKDTLYEVINDESYEMVAFNPNVFKLPEVEEKIFYLQSRGISRKRSQKMSSASLGDSVIYFPHPELQKMFCRENEVTFNPHFKDYYDEVYGGFEEFKKTC